MARGDVKLFNRALLDLGTKAHNLATDTLKLGIVTSGTAPSVNTADPRWGSGGSTNFSTTQVALGTGYTGPVTLASVAWSQVANIPTLRAAPVAIPQDASGGFTDGAWGIIYNDTDAGKRAIGYVDLAGPVGNVNGSLTLDWSGATDEVFALGAN